MKLFQERRYAKAIRRAEANIHARNVRNAEVTLFLAEGRQRVAHDQASAARTIWADAAHAVWDGEGSALARMVLADNAEITVLRLDEIERQADAARTLAFWELAALR